MSTLAIKYSKFVILLVIAMTGVVYCGTSSKNVVAVRSMQPISVDGRLSEEIWDKAIPVSGFRQFDPDEGQPATEETVVRILFDDNALFVGVVCFDSEPQDIVYQLSRRDRTVQSDRFSVMLDSYHDHCTAYLFSGSVSGVQSDGVLSNDGLVYDVQWDAVWEFASQPLADGWSAEFKIPFSAIRFVVADSEYVWGINFRRYIARKKETDEWVMIPRMETPPGTISSVSKMGTLSGILGINPSMHLELLPYHVSKASFLSQPPPFSMSEEYKANFGVDLKYGLSNNFTLDAAVNPDFGQVEVDQSKLNLTVFETFYPEKRPFFLEGAQIFSFGNSFDNQQLRLLYSRRIGRRPSGYGTLWSYDTLYLGSNAHFSKKPEVTAILAAGKLTGRTDNGLEIGALTAVTGKEMAQIEGVNGARSPLMVVEPYASYNAVRLRKTVSDNSTIGFMGTGSYRQGNDVTLSGGFDWNMRFIDGTYGLDGYIAGSHLSSEKYSSYSGSAGRIAFGKLGGENWLLFSSYEFSSDNFMIDDLGYYSQPREHGGYLAITYKEDRAAEPFRRYAVTLQADRKWNWSGIGTISRLEVEPSIEFRNFWQLGLNLIHDFSAYDDWNRGIIGIYRRPALNSIFATLRTDSRKPVELNLYTGYAVDSYRGRTVTAVLQATVRPISWMEFVPGITLMRTRSEESWIIGEYSPDGFNLFGDRDVNHKDLSLRGTITFTKNISFQFFGQLMFAKWRYSNPRKLAGPENLIAEEDNSSRDYFWNVLNGNIVFRWEFIPGSTFYLVWTQSRQDYNGIYNRGYWDDIRNAFRLPMDNVILAKISYWWSI